MRRRWRVTLILWAALAASARGAATEEATPSKRDAPAPVACTVAPLTAAEVLQIARDAASTVAVATPRDTVAADSTPFVPPSGVPANPTTRAAIERAAGELIACTNTYGFQGLAAVATSRYGRAVVAGDIAGGLSEELARTTLAVMPTPLPAEQATVLEAVRDVSVLADGRIGAIIEQDEPGVGHSTLYLIFVVQGDRYLLDDEAIQGFEQEEEDE